MTFTIKLLVNPSETELEVICNVFTVAFVEDEFTAVVLGRDSSLVYDFCKAHVIAAKIAGEIYIAESDDCEIIGSALWFGPGTEIFDSEDQDQNEQALIPLLSKLRPELQEWWSAVFFPQYDEMWLKALGPDMIKDSYNLQLIGTVPASRNQGVARALINEVRRKAAGVPLCLEAVNVGIYQKLGFQAKGTSTTFSNNYGSFPLSVMTAEDPARFGSVTVQNGALLLILFAGLLA